MEDLLDEKTLFRTRRLQMLREVRGSSKLERYGKYCFIPLDIPRIEDPKFVSWFNESWKYTSKIKKDISGLDHARNSYKTVDIEYRNKQINYLFTIFYNNNIFDKILK